MAMEKYDDAGLVLEALVGESPDSAEAWAALALCLAQMGQADAALVCQRQVVRIRGNSR